MLTILSRHVLAHLNFSLAGNNCFWPGQDFFLLLGKTSAGSFRVLLNFFLLLLERPDNGLPKHYFLTGDIYFLCAKQLNTILA